MKLPEFKSLSASRFELSSIAVVQSPFKDKFGIPRQPQLARAARGVIKFCDDPDLRTALRSLEEFSHLWVIFVFHEHGSRNWKPSVRPPRLGGQRKVGVLASRSPHRPNPIGMSVVKIERIDFEAAGGAEIFISGLDLLDGTPVIDIKPYIPYADSVADANPGWAGGEITRFEVAFADGLFVEPELREMISDVIGVDPRPSSQKRQLPPSAEEAQRTNYGIALFGFEIKYTILDQRFLVTSVEPVKE